MTDATDLKPCPFCGAHPGQLADATRILGVWRLTHRCEVIGPFKIESSDRDKVVSTWNRRADLHAERDALAAAHKPTEAALLEVAQAARRKALEEAAAMVETHVYTINGDRRKMEPRASAKDDTHHKTIAAAIRALMEAGE